MNSKSYILAIDQGTTSSRAIVFDASGAIAALAQQEFPQVYPHEGWVEHDPEAIWSSVVEVTRQALNKVTELGGRVLAIGITNQRETTLVWDRQTGEVIYNAIVWQDRRTSAECAALKKQTEESFVSERSGLLLDPYFSSTKIAWILDNVTGARAKAQTGKLAFGTIDSFLIWRLTGGQVHATDITNASRTNLFNIHQQQWDDELLRLFNVPKSVLPEVKDCCADFGVTAKELFGQAIPILGVAGDQQAATVGQCCFSPGTVKSTYGTGCFMVLNTGEKAVQSHNRLLTTIAYRCQGVTHYALEGSIFVAGAAIQWLRDNLNLIATARETEALAEQLSHNGGVYFVPALTGMGAPYWDAEARGAIFGLTRGTKPAHFVRAALESVCYQTHDLLTAMREDGMDARRIRVDGGMVANNWLMQFLADTLNAEVDRPTVLETTALGAANLAALQMGWYTSLADMSEKWQQDRLFMPAMDESIRSANIKGWQNAVGRVITQG